MKARFNGRYSYSLTYLIHYVVFDFIWKILETIALVEVKDSLSKYIILSVICLYITWILDDEVKE